VSVQATHGAVAPRVRVARRVRRIEPRDLSEHARRRRLRGAGRVAEQALTTRGVSRQAPPRHSRVVHVVGPVLAVAHAGSVRLRHHVGRVGFVKAVLEPAATRALVPVEELEHLRAAASSVVPAVSTSPRRGSPASHLPAPRPRRAPRPSRPPRTAAKRRAAPPPPPPSTTQELTPLAALECPLAPHHSRSNPARFAQQPPRLRVVAAAGLLLRPLRPLVASRARYSPTFSFTERRRCSWRGSRGSAARGALREVAVDGT
jgi:hypothetical protein